jgi:DNA-binding response OmpR family regulator
MVKKMRTLPHHCCTPVVYVTALSDYQTRVASVLSGGCELIVKPFNPSEMVVKALTTCLQESIKRLENNHPKDERCQELRPGIPVMV